MKIYAPSYFKEFKCIAGLCRHSCCIGWDVYLDDDTLDLYSTLSGSLGERIRASLTELEDGIGFQMCADGKCPFLNKDGLCDIICENGEGYLGEICSEHPRFYNFFSDRTEAGLGLSCEEASRLILSWKDRIILEVISEDDEEEWDISEDEKYTLEKRNVIFNILEDRSISLEERTLGILKEVGTALPDKTPHMWAEILASLEILDPQWKNTLESLAKFGNYAPIPELSTPLENLLNYFIYRHAASAEDADDFKARIAFCVLSYTLIKAICNAQKAENGTCSLSDLCRIARSYSSEIEYSEYNTLALIETCHPNNNL